MRKHRNPATYALAVLLLLAVVVLTTPFDGTRARWSAAGQAEVPVLTMGVIGFDVAGTGSSATLTNTSGFGVRYRPAQISLLDAGAAVTPPAGLRFAYRTGAACTDPKAAARWTAVAPGGSTPVSVPGSTPAPLERDRPAELCLTVSTDGVAEDALRLLAGRTLQVVTQVEASSLDGGTWSATRPWTVPFSVDLPAAAPPPAPVPERVAQCRVDNSTAVLRWAWSDRPGGPAVKEWQILARPMGSTQAPTVIKTVPDGAQRTAQLGAAELLRVPDLRSSQDYEVLVRAVFAAGGTAHADSAYAWRIKTPGNSGNINCEGLPS